MLVETFKEFSCFSGLKPSIAKYKIAGLGALKGVLEAVCGLKTFNLTNDANKILGIHFLYHNETKTERNFLSIVKKIQNALNVWNTKILAVEGRMYLSLISTVPNSILNEVQKIQKAFLWYSTKPKINHKTPCSTFEEDVLKNVDVKAKIISLQCSWVKKLFDGNNTPSFL